MPKKKISMVSVSSQSDFSSSLADSQGSTMSTVSVKQEKAPKGRFKALVQKMTQEQKKNDKTGEDKKMKTDKETEKGKKPEGKNETKTNEKRIDDKSSTTKKESKTDKSSTTKKESKTDKSSTTKKESNTDKKTKNDKNSKTKNEVDQEKNSKKKQSKITNRKKDKKTPQSSKDTDSSDSPDDTEDMSPSNTTVAGKNIDRRNSSYDGITISIRKKYFLTPEDSDEEEDEGDKGRRSSWIGSFFIQMFLGLRNIHNTVVKMFRSKSIDTGDGVDAVSESVVSAGAKEVTKETDDASVSTVSTRRKKRKSKFRWFWRRKKKGKLRPRKIKKSRGLWRRFTWFTRKKSSVQEPGNVLSAAMT
ncbi:hypothetical protein BgiMline_004127 [Biomphalaria glabrata]|nr:hypothetical protein BgiMline_030371 [Biomphalaria glabrata]KAI8796499.1 hypothetical protein BgiBS90_001676 [Biomphalaria glabrata]